jgi:GAF domain-containing protein
MPPDSAPRAPLSDRLTRLARVTGDLVRAETIEEVSQAVVTHGAGAVGAVVSAMTLVNPDGETARLVAINGGQPDDPEVWGTFPLTARVPSADGIKGGVRFTLTGAELATRYPEVPRRGIESAVVLPLRIADRTIGTIVLSFREERELDSAEIEFLDILADTCAQGLDRIAAKEEAARQSAKLAFLAETANELTSLDYETTLANVARLAVPTFADWSAIDLVEDGKLRRLAVAHIDPAKEQMALDLAERYPPDPDAAIGPWAVMRTSQSELISVITDEMLVFGAIDDEHLEIARALHLRSALTVPLVARGRVLGVLTWVTAESERHYTRDDLELAEAVAKRAAVSIDNSELHSQTMAASVQLQKAVLPQTLPVSEGWEVAHLYSPSGRTEVGGDFYDVIELHGERLVLFVGDVMGRGVDAAAAMAQTRAAVRAYAVRADGHAALCPGRPGRRGTARRQRRPPAPAGAPRRRRGHPAAVRRGRTAGRRRGRAHPAHGAVRRRRHRHRLHRRADRAAARGHHRRPGTAGPSRHAPGGEEADADPAGPGRRRVRPVARRRHRGAGCATLHRSAALSCASSCHHDRRSGRPS